MCEPVTILTAASLALGVGGAIEQHKAQQKAFDVNKQNADAALRINQFDLSMRQQEEKTAAADTIQQGSLQTREASATTEASAAEAGVAGMSVDLLLGDVQRQAGNFRQSVGTNLDATLSQLEREKAGASATAQSRINSVAQPSLAETGLKIGGMAVDTLNQLRIRRPKVA